MTGDQPAAFVPAAPRPGLLARADPSSRRQERRLVREVQRGSAAALEELFRREWPRVVNRAIDVTRARSLRREVDAAAAATAEAPPDPPTRPLSDDVVEAMAELSPEHRAVVVLRFVFDYTPGEIASALDMPRGTVNSRLRRALDRLGEVIER